MSDMEDKQVKFVAKMKGGDSLRKVFAAAVYLERENGVIGADEVPAIVAAAEKMIEAIEEYGAAGEFALEHLSSIQFVRGRFGKHL